MIRLYADFNNRDELGRVLLNTVGSLADIEANKSLLSEGLAVLLYANGELEIVGRLQFDVIWMAVPDWSTLKYPTTEQE